jgi:hypothetical protein
LGCNNNSLKNIKTANEEGYSGPLEIVYSKLHRIISPNFFNICQDYDFFDNNLKLLDSNHFHQKNIHLFSIQNNKNNKNNESDKNNNDFRKFVKFSYENDYLSAIKFLHYNRVDFLFSQPTTFLTCIPQNLGIIVFFGTFKCKYFKKKQKKTISLPNSPQQQQQQEPTSKVSFSTSNNTTPNVRRNSAVLFSRNRSFSDEFSASINNNNNNNINNNTNSNATTVEWIRMHAVLHLCLGVLKLTLFDPTTKQAVASILIEYAVKVQF